MMLSRSWSWRLCEKRGHVSKSEALHYPVNGRTFRVPRREHESSLLFTVLLFSSAQRRTCQKRRLGPSQAKRQRIARRPSAAAEQRSRPDPGACARSRPRIKVASANFSPAYPLSANTCWMNGKMRREAHKIGPPPSRSWMLAGCG